MGRMGYILVIVLGLVFVGVFVVALSQGNKNAGQPRKRRRSSAQPSAEDAGPVTKPPTTPPKVRK